MQTLTVTDTPVDLEAQPLSFLPGAPVAALNVSSGGVVMLASDTDPGPYTPVAEIVGGAAQTIALPSQRYVKTFAGSLVLLAI